MRKTLLALALVACGDPSPAIDAGASQVDAADLDGAGWGSCAGACQATALTATFGATARVLDRAAYGVTAGDGTLHVEAYRGGAAGCPSASSPAPDYTLVLGAVPVPTDATASTSPGNLLDFVGDLLGGPLGAAATEVTVTPVAAAVCVGCVGQPAPSDPAGLVALDVALTFADGTVTGHLFARHCDSLDEPAAP